MANLDIANRPVRPVRPAGAAAAAHTDGLDSGGFLEHLKLPHYVTFRSMVERNRHYRRRWPPVLSAGRIPEPPEGTANDLHSRTTRRAAASAAPAGFLDRGRQAGDPARGATAICVPGYQVPFRPPAKCRWPAAGARGPAGDACGDSARRTRQGDRPGTMTVGSTPPTCAGLIAETTGCGESADTREATSCRPATGCPRGLVGRPICWFTRCRCRAAAQGGEVGRGVRADARRGDLRAMWVSLYEDIVRQRDVTAQPVTRCWSPGG